MIVFGEFTQKLRNLSLSWKKLNLFETKKIWKILPISVNLKKKFKNQKKNFLKNDNVVLFFKEKQDKFLNYQGKMYLYKFKMYIKKNADWVCN